MLVAAVAVAACSGVVSSAASAEVIRTIHVGNAPEGVSSYGGDVWVSNAFENTVSEIEASSGEVIRTIPVGNRPDWRVFGWNPRLGRERLRRYGQ